MRRNDFLVLPQALQERFIATVKERLPRKSFGYFLAKDAAAPSDFVLFEDNIRNSEDWKDKFESYGQYFVAHDDAGFVATPEETWRVQKEIWARGMVEVGVFHSHLRHPGNFSQIDYEMHMLRFNNLWHVIISMRNPDLPQLRAFAVSQAGVRELQVISTATDRDEGSPNRPLIDEAARNATIAEARVILALDARGRPQCKDSSTIFTAINSLLRTEHSEAIEELLVNGFLRGSRDRYDEYVALDMRTLNGGRYQMGTSQALARHFFGEVPAHMAHLSPFNIARIQVTQELYGLFDQRRLNCSTCDRRKPVVGVTWFDAAVFAMWMGCRLPTEAEWEFACGAGNESEWCCGDESLLPRYAWYSANSGPEAQSVATREPNSFGLFDLHGNVWEWCQDSYDQDYYSCSPIVDPLNIGPAVADKVVRGGGILALSEMCRTRYRLHEPPAFRAGDLGFRLAQNAIQTSSERT